MNLQQKIFMWMGVLVIVVMTIYPPWISRGDIQRSWYGWIWQTTGDPKRSAIYSPVYIDLYRLIPQYFATIVGTGALIITFNKKNNN